MKNDRPIGQVIKEIAAEKNLRIGELAESAGKSRQGMYVVFSRSEMKNEELEEWAKILNVTKEYLFERWKSSETKSTDVTSNYLIEHLTALEEQFKRVLNQLEVKDRQIEKLMDLLGKPKDVAHLTTPIIKLLPNLVAKTA